MTTTSADKAKIRELIEQWCAAVRRKDYDGVLKPHSVNMLMFDVPGPFQSEGLEALAGITDQALDASMVPQDRRVLQRCAIGGVASFAVGCNVFVDHVGK